MHASQPLKHACTCHSSHKCTFHPRVVPIVRSVQGACSQDILMGRQQPAQPHAASCSPTGDSGQRALHHVSIMTAPEQLHERATPINKNRDGHTHTHIHTRAQSSRPVLRRIPIPTRPATASTDVQVLVMHLPHKQLELHNWPPWQGLHL